jgi:medium-chain acyl-[acyl-carrier-protein] hydrolase
VGDAPAVWVEGFRVRAYEVGVHGRLGALDVCNWLQEAAGNHATALGWAVDQLTPRGLTWVLSRLHLRMDVFPRWREEVVVRTWPAGARRVYAVREFTLQRPDGEELGRATTGWMLINLATRRPVRPPAEVEELARNAPPRVIDDPFPRLEGPTPDTTERSFTVRAHDLDLNGHANNVAVIAWTLESLPVDTLASSILSELEIEFRGESRAGDRIAARVEPAALPGTAFLHALARQSDSREVARARTVWKVA